MKSSRSRCLVIGPLAPSCRTRDLRASGVSEQIRMRDPVPDRPTNRKVSALSLLERGRRHCAQRAWAEAFRALAAADRETPLEVGDLELLALAAYLVGRDEDYLKTLERACNAHRNAGDNLRAVRCAFWLSFRLLMRSETGRATGWLARAQRLLELGAGDCAERGLLLLPAVERYLDSGDYEAAFEAAAEAAAIGERCGDADLIACARHQQGRARLLQGQVESGLALLDETMVAVIAGDLSPLVTGLMFCSVIHACQEIFAFDRSREWTAALAQWCKGQPEMVAFAGVCQVHRAEIMQLQGAWPEAIEAARHACLRSREIDRRATAAALYQQGELHRLQGQVEAAEAAYHGASQLGLEPQPGLSLLRLVQGQPDAAAVAIRRVAGSVAGRVKRMNLLPAYIEIMLATGDVREARSACAELKEIAANFDTRVPGAIAAQACGAVDLAEGDARAALASLRPAFEVWQSIEAPYAGARVRVLIGLACRALGDEDGAGLELAAARSAFQRLGATPDLERIDKLITPGAPKNRQGLTPRELQVLRIVAGGETNRAIAAQLCISEKTVDRHVSNIFTKLDVSSRAAATAFAIRHNLI